jgi:hypothetical protein
MKLRYFFFFLALAFFFIERLTSFHGGLTTAVDRVTSSFSWSPSSSP